MPSRNRLIVFCSKERNNWILYFFEDNFGREDEKKKKIEIIFCKKVETIK
jgi:hypothetical protein